MAAVLNLLAAPAPAAAHCDTMEGPVVKAAQTAFETGALAHVLPWARAQDEPEIRHVFEHTLRVRSLNGEDVEGKLRDLQHIHEGLARVVRSCDAHGPPDECALIHALLPVDDFPPLSRLP
jgi:hypothetical protein